MMGQCNVRTEDHFTDQRQKVPSPFHSIHHSEQCDNISV